MNTATVFKRFISASFALVAFIYVFATETVKNLVLLNGFKAYVLTVNLVVVVLPLLLISVGIVVVKDGVPIVLSYLDIMLFLIVFFAPTTLMLSVVAQVLTFSLAAWRESRALKTALAASVLVDLVPIGEPIVRRDITVARDQEGAWLQWVEDHQGELVTCRQAITDAFKASVLTNSLKEMAIPRSRPANLAKEPADFVTFREIDLETKKSEILACGARIKIGERSNLLLTAHHVWKQLLERGLPVHLAHGAKAHPVGDSWKVYVASRDLDIVIFEVPNSVWSILEVRPIKLSTAPIQGGPVHAVGYINGKLVQTYGQAKTFPSFPMGLLHTCSTIPSFSGTILRSKDMAVGLHFSAAPRHIGSYNVATCLSFLENVPEVYDNARLTWKSGIDQDVREWDDHYEAVVQFEDKVNKLMSKGSKYFHDDSPTDDPLFGLSWSEYMDYADEAVLLPWEVEDMDRMHDAMRGQECAKAVRVSRKRGAENPPVVIQPVVVPAKTVKVQVAGTTVHKARVRPRPAAVSVTFSDLPPARRAVETVVTTTVPASLSTPPKSKPEVVVGKPRLTRSQKNRKRAQSKALKAKNPNSPPTPAPRPVLKESALSLQVNTRPVAVKTVPQPPVTTTRTVSTISSSLVNTSGSKGNASFRGLKEGPLDEPIGCPRENKQCPLKVLTVQPLFFHS